MHSLGAFTIPIVLALASLCASLPQSNTLPSALDDPPTSCSAVGGSGTNVPEPCTRGNTNATLDTSEVDSTSYYFDLEVLGLQGAFSGYSAFNHTDSFWLRLGPPNEPNPWDPAADAAYSLRVDPWRSTDAGFHKPASFASISNLEHISHDSSLTSGNLKLTFSNYADRDIPQTGLLKPVFVPEVSGQHPEGLQDLPYFYFDDNWELKFNLTFGHEEIRDPKWYLCRYGPNRLDDVLFSLTGNVANEFALLNGPQNNSSGKCTRFTIKPVNFYTLAKASESGGFKRLKRGLLNLLSTLQYLPGL